METNTTIPEKIPDRANSIPATTPDQASTILTDDVRELIDRKPPWVVRNGNLFFFLLLLGILAVTWFIRVPVGNHQERLLYRFVHQFHGPTTK